MLVCPLCHEPHDGEPYAEDRLRRYFHCVRCDLVFADPASHLDAQAERAVYDEHENSPADAGYRQFLSRLTVPLLARLTAGMRGLDYGSGPGPTLAVMLEEAGMRMVNYDPFYAPDASVLSGTYDFVTCTETAEHFHHPAREFARLSSLVRPGGYLGVMTKRVISQERFETWHYKNDPTHVSFYSRATFDWIAATFSMAIDHEAADVVVLRRA